jgi:hypothetical protein
MRANPGCLTKREQKVFMGVEIPVCEWQDIFTFPYLFRRDEEAWIVIGLQKVPDIPFVIPIIVSSMQKQGEMVKQQRPILDVSNLSSGL